MPIQVIDAGENVVGIYEARAHGKHSDAEVKVTGAHLRTLRDGRIIAWHVYLDPAVALEAAGLEE